MQVIRNEKTLEQKENILREVKVMKSLRHQYVITYR
jgi:serine/threonine protein kinase